MNKIKNALPSPPADYPFQSQFVTIEGYKIHYIEKGQGDPVLFIHGNPTSSYLWRNVLPSVSQKTNRRGMALDLLGFGKSDKPNIAYSLKLHAKIIEGFIRELNLNNMILVADDWGGPLGTYNAIQSPDKFQSIVLMESFLWPMTWMEDFSPEFRTPFKLMRTPLGFVMIQVMNFMAKKIIPQHCPISKDALDYYIHSFPTIASRKAMRDFPKLLAVEGEPKESEAFIQEIQAGLSRLNFPVAWIKATPGIVPSDDFPSSLRHLESLKKKLPQLTIKEFGPGHHFLAEENPERLSSIIIEWIMRERFSVKR